MNNYNQQGKGYGNGYEGYNYNNANMDNGMNNRMNNGKVHKNKKGGFQKGFLIGMLCTIFAVVLVLSLIFGSLVSAGYIHISKNGEIYVQSDSVNDEQGIGSDVESKLNALDSLLDDFYFDEADKEQAKTNIYKAYLDSFGDKYTVYYTAEEYQSLLESTTGKFYGIGAVCQKYDDGTILISEAYKDAPAYNAGIRTGDRVSKVNGEDITSMDLSTAVAKIKGDKGTTVNLEIIRNNETLQFTVTRDEIKVQTVEHEMMDDKIGYIYISQFDDVTTQQFKDAYDDLVNQGMQGLVIDIRNNPGGVMSTVINMLDMLLPNGLIVYTEDKDGNKKEYKGSNSSEIYVPAAVLVNGNSASASEIFSGAMQDYGKAKIIGTQTYGKGIVQTIRPLSDGSAVKYTIAKYFTPKGQDIHGKGVTPDIVVELDENSDKDTQLEAAVNYVKSQK